MFSKGEHVQVEMTTEFYDRTSTTKWLDATYIGFKLGRHCVLYSSGHREALGNKVGIRKAN